MGVHARRGRCMMGTGNRRPHNTIIEACMDTQRERQLREKLSSEVCVSTWKGLIPDLLSRALFIVAPDLDLVEVGVQVALDNTMLVNEWIASGSLSRPSREQIDEWETTGSLFRFIIVSPFVFFQVFESPTC